jgi:hypothetical protein
MQLVGRGAGPVRAPFKPLSPSELDDFAVLLNTAGLKTS